MINNARAESDALHSRADKSGEFDKTGESTPVSDGEGSSYENKRSGHAKRGSI